MGIDGLPGPLAAEQHWDKVSDMEYFWWISIASKR
jgi:hypothetical protein